MEILETKKLTKYFGGVKAVDDFSVLELRVIRSE